MEQLAMTADHLVLLAGRKIARPRAGEDQQRFAAEMSIRLSRRRKTQAIEPGRFFSSRPLWTWFWLMIVLPLRTGDRLLVSLRPGLPVLCRRRVLVVHELFPSGPGRGRSLRSRAREAFFSWQLRGAAGVIALSAPVADQVRTLYRGPVVVAPIGPSAVIEGGGEPSDCLVPGLLGVAGLRFLLAVVGDEPRDNLDRLAAAYGCPTVSERAAHPLVVVSTQNRRCPDHVSWPPGTVLPDSVTESELRELYHGAYAIVFVSLAESVGRTVIEAVAAGARHLVLSDLPVYRWICGETAHYVDPSVVESIIAGLRRSISEPRLQQTDRSRFSWKSSADEIYDFCCNLI